MVSTTEKREHEPNPTIALACCTGTQHGIVNSTAAAWICDRFTGPEIYQTWTKAIQSED